MLNFKSSKDSSYFSLVGIVSISTIINTIVSTLSYNTLRSTVRHSIKRLFNIQIYQYNSVQSVIERRRYSGGGLLIAYFNDTLIILYMKNLVPTKHNNKYWKGFQ